jgi:hypothetical protein
MSKKPENKEKLKILDKYCSLAKKNNFHPSRTDMINAGVSRDRIRHHFGSHTKLKLAAKEHAPKVFESIVDESLFTPKAFQALRQEAGRFSRYVVTTAVAGCKVHDGFFSSIENYNKRRKAMTLVLPAMDPAANVPFHLDPKLSDTALLVDDLALNDNIFVSSIRLSAKHIDPVTGLSRIGQRNGSFIYASPKQRLKMSPTSNVKLPHAMMTTGALTKPDYSTDRYMSERTAYIAEHDHVLGAIIVEVEDDEIFHYRQVQADRQGNFIDLGVVYRPDGTQASMRPEALVLGDWHSGETDPVARAAFVDAKDSVLSTVKPKRVVIHDGFNGRSISHHEIKNKILRAQRAKEGHLNLASELEEYANDLQKLAANDFVEEIIIVKSNHDEFLDRYLAEGRYIEDAHNHEIAVWLAGKMLKGENPVKAFMESVQIKGAEKIRWLERDEDYKIAGIELGAHGDKGANGARGSLLAMEHAYGNSVSGHSHTPEILRGAWQVGTTSLLKLGYNQGPSSWMHTACLVYPNGSRQLINIIEGKWRLKD